MSTVKAPSRDPMPPAVRRLLWWIALPLATMFARAVFYRLPAAQPTIAAPSVWFSLGSVLFLYVPVLVATLAMSIGYERIKRAVRAARGRACVNCVYDLSAFEDSGTCPECGHPFQTAADQRRWAWVRMHKESRDASRGD